MGMGEMRAGDVTKEVERGERECSADEIRAGEEPLVLVVAGGSRRNKDGGSGR